MFRRTGIVVAALAAATVFSFSLRADDHKPAAPTPEQMQEMMKAWEAFATPGQEHKKLAELVGNWTCVVEDFSSGQPTTSEGSAKYTMIMGGRYLMQEYEGKMMGASFTGIGLTGFNNETKKFQNIWIDSMGTGIFFAQGTQTAPDKVECKGMMEMPGMPPTESRTVSTWVDKDHHTFEMYMPGPDGKEMLGVKISYTRAK